MSPYVLTVTIAWGVFLLWWVVSAFFIKHDRTGGWWWRAGWLRVTLIFLAIGWIANHRGHGPFQIPLFTFAEPHLPALEAVGACLCVFGVGFAIWARIHLGRNWSPAPALKEEHELVTSGPYAFVRHPIYTGMLLAMLGSALVSPAWAVILIVASTVFVRRVYIEEGLMQGQFPSQYPEYKKRTWALIPYVW